MGETPAAVRSGRPQPESKPQIMVRLKLLAVNLDELRRAGFELLSLQQLLDSDTPTSFLDDRGTIAKFLALLQEQCLVKTLAEPALVTVAGRRAEFATSALRYECTPDLAADGALRLGIQLKLDGPAADATGEASAALPSSTRSLAIATTVQMRPGQTLILAGPQARGQDRSTTGILLLVNADLVKAQPDDLKSH
jgi:Flp pilus assembly secretin CpaC